MDKFRACLFFYHRVLFPQLGEMISLMKYPLSCQQYFAYLAVFFTWVSCLTPKFEAHDRKMSLQKFPRMTKKGYLAILFQINTGVLST